MKKGQSEILTHALLISITVALVFVVVYTFNNIRRDYQEFSASNDLGQVCLAIRSGIEKTYSDGSYHSPTYTTYGRMTITLPEKIGDMKYRTYFSNRSLLILSEIPDINTSCIVGLDADYRGSTTGGVTEIRYDELANGTRRISVEKVY